MRFPLKQRGQSAVEFLLTVPLLFFIFLGIIQLAFSGYVCFSVQRAANAIAREAASSDDPTQYDPTLQLGYCLAPLGQLNHQTLATVLATKWNIQTDGQKVHVDLSYPMPIWVPGVGSLMGQKLSLSPADAASMSSALQIVFQALGKPLPDFTWIGSNLPYVHLVSFSCDTVDENSVGSEDTGV